jgi:hypothetical protein
VVVEFPLDFKAAAGGGYTENKVYMSSSNFLVQESSATTDPTFTGRLAGLPEDHDQHGLDRID